MYVHENGEEVKNGKSINNRANQRHDCILHTAYCILYRNILMDSRLHVWLFAYVCLH